MLNAYQPAFVVYIINLILLKSYRGGAKYVDLDDRPYCKKCYDKIPTEFRRRMKKQVD